MYKIRAVLLILAVAAAAFFLTSCSRPATGIVSIEVAQLRPVYEGQELSEASFSVFACMKDGHREEVHGFSLACKDDGQAEVIYDGCRKVIEVEVMPVTSIMTLYDGTVWEGGHIMPQRIIVRATYEDGSSYEARDISFDDPGPVNGKMSVPLHTEVGDTALYVRAVKFSYLTVEYLGGVHVGEALDKANFRVTEYDTSGEGHLTQDFEISTGNAPVEKDMDVAVACNGEVVSVHVSPVQVSAVYPRVEGTLSSGGTVSLSSLVAVYDDGHIHEIPVEEAVFTTPLESMLSIGDNEYSFLWNGGSYSFTVHASSGTFVSDAKAAFAEEAENALYSHITDNIFVTVNHYEDGAASYYLAHVVINGAAQLKSGLSNGTYGGSREKPTDAAARLGWVIGVNGSNFDYGTGTPVYAGCVIKDSRVMEGTRTNGMEICLMDNGVLFSPEAGVDPDLLVASGVTDSWSCGDTLLINDGKAANVGIQSEQYRYPRTAVGMVQPCEYYLLVAGSHDYQGGMTYDEVREVLMSHGCSFGKCMDGGGSSSLVLDGKLVNTPAVGDAERAVVDYLYFVE